MPYFWAAYRTGAFEGIGDGMFRAGLGQPEFIEALERWLSALSLTPIVYAHNGVVVGFGTFWVRGRVWQTADIIWFRWSTPRKILETYVNFVNEVRKTVYDESGNNMILEFAAEKDQAFFDHVCKYGIMRRVGTSHEIYDGKCLIYESRSFVNA